MIPTHDSDRQVIPRWLSIRKTIEAGELSDSGRRIVQSLDENQDAKKRAELQFKIRLREWREEHDISAAEELLASAILLGFISHDEVRSAAKLVSQDGRVLSGSRDLANAILGTPSETSAAIALKPKTYLELARRKKLIRLYPRDSLLLTETALLYTTIGEINAAAKYIRAAIALSPDNRYVLRSASRFWVHAKKPGRALYLLNNSLALRYDPWLLSAKVAIESSLHRPASAWRDAKRMLSAERFSPHDVAELAAAIGTLQLYSGSHRASRKSFRQSLLKPTENSLAQVQWARDRDTAIDEADTNSAPLAFEAMAIQRYSARQWTASIDATKKWHQMEPFSTRPAIQGSFVAMTLIGDLDLAADFCRAGLEANRGDSNLSNNLAVVLAMKGDIEGAKKVLESITSPPENANERVVQKATLGLIELRRGNVDMGVNYYFEALALATQSKSKILWARGLVHLARELLNIDHELSLDLLQRVNPMLTRDDGRLRRIAPDIDAVAEQVREGAKMIGIRESIRRVVDQRFATSVPAPPED